MQWPRETPRRYRVRNRPEGWRELVVAFAVLLALIGACVYFRPFVPTSATYDCRVIATCEQTLPECGPNVRVPADGQPVWYWGRQQPRNAPALLGFQPLLPTRISYPVSWDSALLVGPQMAPGNAPMQREIYINWQSLSRYPSDPLPYMLLTPTPTPAPAPPSHEAIYVLDETTAALGPLTGVADREGMEYAAQSEVTLGAATGTLYYLAPKGGIPTPLPPSLTPTPIPTATFPYTTMARSTPSLLTATEPSPVTVTATSTPTIYTVPADSYFALVLLWHAGPVTLRVIAVSSDYSWALDVHTSDAPNSAAILIKSSDNRGYPYPYRVTPIDLLQLAASVQPYTSCGR
jgi:hypothetical protein